MTTSQASRIYGIPYNSLLMYVRGKYGKSLKLDKLKETTPAANDNLNTIGNSRSTPKEKMAEKKTKHGSGSSSGSSKKSEPFVDSSSGANPFMAAMTGLTFGAEAGRVKDVMAQIQSRQALLDHSERLKELEKHMGPEQAKLLMPFFASAAATADSHQLTSADLETSADILAEKERVVQDILIEATKKNTTEDLEEDDNRNTLNSKQNQHEEISAGAQ